MPPGAAVGGRLGQVLGISRWLGIGAGADYATSDEASSNIDLEDALQEVFVVAHDRPRDFDPDRALVTTWLIGICSNVGREFRRRVRRRSRAAEVEPRAGLPLTPEDELHRARMRVRLLTLLDGLSPALPTTPCWGKPRKLVATGPRRTR